MYNSIPTKKHPDWHPVDFLIVAIIAFLLMLWCNSCKSERNTAYPVVHKEKLLSAGRNPNRH